MKTIHASRCQSKKCGALIGSFRRKLLETCPLCGSAAEASLAIIVIPQTSDFPKKPKFDKDQLDLFEPKKG